MEQTENVEKTVTSENVGNVGKDGGKKKRHITQKTFKEWMFAYGMLSFLVGDNAMLQIRMHTNLSAGGIQIHAMGSALGDGNQMIKLTDAQATAVFDKFKENTAVEFVVACSQGKYYVFINDELVLTTEYDFKISGNSFGVGSCVCNGWLNDCVPYEFKFAAGEDKVNALVKA